MYKNSILIVGLLISIFVNSQNVFISRNVIGSYGEAHLTTNLYVMDNLGETAVKSTFSNNLYLTQGFEQSNYSMSPVIVPMSPVNAFSPDNDGVNDTWILPINELYAENTVLIFNRWGEVIRKFTNYNNLDVVWDGSNQNNQQVVSGTYFYVIEVSSQNISISGWVQIIR